jgi:DNA polymerase-4
VKLRTGDFRTAPRRLTPEEIPSSAEELTRIGLELITRFEFGDAARYRLAGIGLSNFVDEDDEPPPDEEPTLFGSDLPR